MQGAVVSGSAERRLKKRSPLVKCSNRHVKILKLKGKEMKTKTLTLTKEETARKEGIVMNPENTPTEFQKNK